MITLQSGHIVGGRYTIERSLGQGGYGATYLAQDANAFGEKCAVKHFNFVNSDPALFKKAQELFKREAEILHDLNRSKPSHISNSIPDFLGFYENPNLCLIQEYIEGETLRKELRQKGKLQENEVAELLEDMLEVLKFLHGKGIIHRDIKPENLMRRSKDRTLVLIDFGAVKPSLASVRNSSPQNPGTQIYTPGYGPPEQEKGRPESNSDIYALGMTALEALTGVEPQQLKDPRTGDVIWPRQLNVSNRLVEILEKMVHKDCKNGRYKLANDVLDDIKDFRKTQIVPPIPPPKPWKPLPMWLRFGITVPIVMAIFFPIAFVVAKAIITSRPIVPPNSPSQEADTSQPRTTPNSPSQEVDTSQPRATPTPPTKDKETGSSLSPPENCGPFRRPGKVCTEDKNNTSY